MKQENQIKAINCTYIIETWNIQTGKLLLGDGEKQRNKWWEQKWSGHSSSKRKSNN